MRTMTWTALAAAAVLALGACAAIPDSGPVEEGNADVSPVEPLVPIQEGPGVADGPQAIITGFLRESASGIATNFDVAREFLTADAAATWDPSARTLVYDSGAGTPEWNEATRTATYEVPLASAVDDSGRRTDSGDEDVAQLEFTVEQDSEGQWRISKLDDGVILSQANFDRFFRPVDLVFATADHTTVVPEVRWLPDNNIATAASRELIEGPSTWLADAVTTGFPATAALAVESVVVTDGTATVDLTPGSAGTDDQRALAQEQLRLTLTSLPAVTGVDVRIAGLPISAAGSVVLEAAPVPDETAAAMVQGRLGTWDGEQLWATPLTVGATPEGARGIARSYDGSTVAFVAGGSLRLSGALDPESAVLVEADEDLGEPSGLVDSAVVADGVDLVAPSFDRHGYVWTAQRSIGAGLLAVAPDGTATTLPSDWLQTRSVIALSVSRDGARLVVVSRSGGQPVVEVAGIVRDAEGAPLGVGEPIAVGTGVGAGVDVVWVDDSTVGVLGEVADGAPTQLWSVEVGGATTLIPTVRDGVGVAVRAGESSLLVVAADGHVEERSGSSWVPVTDGVAELAYSG